jgi:hypothetical protein
MASHAQVAHRWAQDDATARTVRGFNIFFDRAPSYPGLFGCDIFPNTVENVIYSHGYHFPIAAFQTTRDGARVVLGNFSERYSVSTSKHQREVSRAIPSHYTVFDVPHVSPYRTNGDLARFHEMNLEALLERVAENASKAKRARVNAPWLYEQAANWLRQAQEYALTFGLAPVADDVAGAADTLASLQAEAQRVYAEARARREAIRAEARALERQEQSATFAAWQSGEPGARVPYAWATDETGAVYVRRNGDTLETSRGASVPWEHAVKAFRIIRQVKARGVAWASPPEAPVRVGHFRVDRIEANGDMHAGCHFFAWAHMAALAEREGV